MLARSAFNHSVDYRSVMAFGHARMIDDEEEKARARCAHGRPLLSRPHRDSARSTPQEIKATRFVGMEIEQASAKVRAKGIGDDEEDYALPVYAERIPVHTVLGRAGALRAFAARRRAPGSAGWISGGPKAR